MMRKRMRVRTPATVAIELSGSQFSVWHTDVSHYPILSCIGVSHYPTLSCIGVHAYVRAYMSAHMHASELECVCV